jgi:hypothetical protein
MILATTATAESLGLGAAFLSAIIFFIIAFFRYPQA